MSLKSRSLPPPKRLMRHGLAPAAMVLMLSGALSCGLGLTTGTAQAQQSGPSAIGTIPTAKQSTKTPNQLLRAPSRNRAPTVPEGLAEPPRLQSLDLDRAPIADPAAQLSEFPARIGTFNGDLGVLGIDQLSGPDQYFGNSFIEGIDSGSNPPDTVHDVGPNHIVQMTNGTSWRVWDKDGNPLTGTLGFANLWPSGDPCNSNLGDPIVVYDHLADRWLLSQFARNSAETQFWMCIAISQTPDPTLTNQYWLYTIEVDDFPDYPKFGVWPNAYYMSSFEGADLGVFAFDRDTMLQGQATSFVKFTISSLSGTRRTTRILPADLDGPPPPAGTPNFFFRPVDDQQDAANPVDRLEIFEFVIDWNNIPGASFTLVDTINAASTPPLLPFEVFDCDRNGTGDPDFDFRDCIPQPNTTATIDALSNRPMMQLKFRNFDGDFRMVVNQTVDISGSLPTTIPVTPTEEVAGVRWYELQKNGANWVIRQQGTYGPQPNGADTEAELQHRWMGSAAMDSFGNIAMGYSIVNDDDANPIFPGIRYTGRAAGDVLGTMPQGEKIVFNGTVSQGGNGAFGQRWGDYSAMTVDPRDDCTFWYTTHVSQGETTSRTKIASFRFSGCGTDLAIKKSANPDPVVPGGALTYTVTVYNYGPQDATNVIVTDTLPANVTYVANTDACVPAGQVLTCDLGDIPVSGQKSFEISVTVAANASAPLTNKAVVASDQAENDPSDNTVTLTTLVQTSADLVVAKLCKPDDDAPAGTIGTCTIFVDNLGPSDAQNVVLTDTHVSEGSFTITSATAAPGGPCNIADGVVTCNLGTEPAGGRTTITVKITSNDGVDVNDLASVASTTSDPKTSNNRANGTLSFEAVADLAVTKTDAPDPVGPGGYVTYTLQVTNNGPSTAPNVVLTDVLPAQVTLLSATPSVGTCNGVANPGQQPLTCNLGSFTNGQSASITVVVRVNEDVPDGTMLVNNASVASNVSDPNNTNNIATTSTKVINSADLYIHKTADKYSYKIGEVITYTITVKNNGVVKAKDVVVSDILPDPRRVAYQSNTGGCVKTPRTTNQLTCNLGKVDVGETRTFYIYAVVKASSGSATNKASVSSTTPDPNKNNNSSQVTVALGK